MNKKLLPLLLYGSLSFNMWSQQTITGHVANQADKAALWGASVQIKGAPVGTETDLDGNFSLISSALLPVTLVISYTGFETKEVVATDAHQPLQILLSAQVFTMMEVKVTGQRISDQTKKAPLTIETLDIVDISQTPSENFYEALGHLKGVDMTSASLGFKVVNTRGFNSTVPIRSLQLIDGVDNASPSLNFALGNFLGAGELDLTSVELAVGPGSAFYGPSAFNGVISMKTKDPFILKGLTVQLKAGERNLREGALRWADALKNKNGKAFFAYKMNFSYLKAYDWEARNFGLVDGSKVSKDNPGGFDAVNRYGDEYNAFYDASSSAPWTYPGLGIFYRTAYAEKDLVDYNTDNLKAGLALHFRTKPDKDYNAPEFIFPTIMAVALRLPRTTTG